MTFISHIVPPDGCVELFDAERHIFDLQPGVEVATVASPDDTFQAVYKGRAFKTFRPIATVVEHFVLPAHCFAYHAEQAVGARRGG